MTSRDTALGVGAEFDLIRALRARWGDVAVGIGDDAAVLRPARGDSIVLTTDTAIEGVHFRREWLTWQEIGYRAVTAALSDLAAMAAAPLGVLVSFAFTDDARAAALEIADGVADATRAVDALILGGNVARSPTFSITVTAIGSVYSPLARSGGRPGDLLYVTGALGGPRAALRAWAENRGPDAPARARFARPSARIREARWLAERGAVAAIDISDGLAADATHLASASGCAVEVQAERVPRFAGASENDALSSGEEYELLVFARAPLPHQEFAERFQLPLTLIGRAVEGGCELRVTRDGKRVAGPEGYDHFSR